MAQTTRTEHRRGFARAALAAGLGCTLVFGGCGDEPKAAVERKALLRPNDAHQRQMAELARRQIFDDQGELIPSGERIAGLELPKGVKVYRTLDQEHYLEAPRIVLEQLDRYFAPRLLPSSVERNVSSVTYSDAQLKDDLAAPRVTVRIARLRSTEPNSDLYIRQAKPRREFPSAVQAEASLQERRKYAD